MQLYLVRHGEAEAAAVTDSQRQLTSRGELEASTMAGKLAERLRAEGERAAGEAVISDAFVSPYVRARQTADRLRAELPALSFEESPLLVPEADPRELLDYLDERGLEQVLLVGHNPLLSDVASILVNGRKDCSVALDTSHLVCIDAEHLGPGQGTISFQIQRSASS